MGGLKKRKRNRQEGLSRKEEKFNGRMVGRRRKLESCAEGEML